MKFFSRSVVTYILRGVAIVIGLVVITFAIVNISTEPRNDRDWNNDQKVLPYAEINNNIVNIYNIRNFKYASTTEYIENYYDASFDINKLKRVWYVVEPFSGMYGSAHTLMSFEFEDNRFVAISVEIRKEKGESFDALKGLFNSYELMYVIADEKDVIQLRSNHRKDTVYVYPIKTTQEKAQKMFIDMVKRANDLREKPEFYNTLTNTCTTNIVKHMLDVSEHKVSLWDPRILLPAYSDSLAYKLGLIDTDLSFDDARTYYRINERALKYANSDDFSVKIREGGEMIDYRY